MLAPAKSMRRSQLDLLPVPRGAILFLGDSITEAGEWQEWFPGRRVINRGVGGETVGEVRARLDLVLNHPAAIFLLVGTNDFSGYGPSRRVADVAAQLADLITDIRRRCPDAPLFVNSVMPRDRWFSGRVIQLNAALSAIVEQAGGDYVDVWPKLADSRGRLADRYTKDHIHLTGEGYEAWVDTLRPHVNSVRLDPQT